MADRESAVSNRVGEVSLASEKVIAAVGVPEEDVAHLRLLMRKGAGSLTNSWRWGSDTSADLLIVDTSVFAGQMALARGRVTGMRVAVVCAADATTEGEPALRRPFQVENVIQVLEDASGTPMILSSKPLPGEDFLEASLRDAGLLLGDSSLPYDDDAPSVRKFDGVDVAQGLDEMIRGNPLADPYANLKPTRFDESTSLEATGAHTRRSEARAERERETLGDPLAMGKIERSPTAKKADPEANAAHPLREYLEGRLLGGPVQIAWPDAGVLTLDPKNKVYHSAQGLAELEVYCRQSPRRSDWRPLTTPEFAEIRDTQPSQPYHKLIWLDVLLHSEGKLAAHLDPGGTYELKRWVEIARDYPQYSRISAALMQPTRLHEIAASCNASMDKVFSVVNAYDAIGCLSWTPRPPRHAEPEDEGKMSSLFKRLRKPFGKS